jgi:hypothetical protein
LGDQKTTEGAEILRLKKVIRQIALTIPQGHRPPENQWEEDGAISKSLNSWAEEDWRRHQKSSLQLKKWVTWYPEKGEHREDGEVVIGFSAEDAVEHRVRTAFEATAPVDILGNKEEVLVGVLPYPKSPKDSPSYFKVKINLRRWISCSIEPA